MTVKNVLRTAAMLALLSSTVMFSSCTSGGAASAASASAAAKIISVTVKSANGDHHFEVELAHTQAEQQRGLMFRTNIPQDGGMLFSPHPPEGGPPTEASFWMKDTPSPLDIIFIRTDGTIARIAENTTPFSQTPIPSGEPVSAVLELRGGRTAELGIAEGDQVSWAGR
ncbi:MAG: DUF192 domain-containing protein [Sphingomonas sp.]|jgi:hypothetical protein